MTEAELITEVGTAMSRTLYADWWSTLSERTREAAALQASGDILARLPGQTLAGLSVGSHAFLAMVEQAAYLAKNADGLTDAARIASESVDGLSVTYERRSGEDSGLAPRAEAHLAAARRASLARMRFTRG